MKKGDGIEDGKEYVVVIPAKAGIQRQHGVTDFSGMTRSGVTGQYGSGGESVWIPPSRKAGMKLGMTG
ncbi:hypothetical protein [Endozoicomonas sp. ALB060]|uniref:hypothetical protein n=1 Tax=Endozoicomonas sp. ALB060 TaxID=3403072 RepID=UPI003BB77B47